MPVRTITRRSKTALGEAILEAGLAAGLAEEQVARQPTKPKRHVKRRGRNAKRGVKQKVGILWDHPIANLTITVDEGSCKPSESDGPNTWAQLMLDKGCYQPKKLNVRLNLVQLEDNILKYLVTDGDQCKRVHDATLPTLTIPVTWNQQGQPQMRKQDGDNVDVILINEDGLGVQLQVSVVVRSGFDHKRQKAWWRIFVQLQEMHSLQIVTTTQKRAHEFGLTAVPTEHAGVVATVIPLFGYHNRPGTDWLSVKNSAEFGIKEVVPTCLRESRYNQLSNAWYEDWEPAKLGVPTVEGKVRGVVSFYNLIWHGGAGFIQLENGKSIFVHWRQLRDVHALQPMSVVEFYVGEHDGRPQAKAVQVV